MNKFYLGDSVYVQLDGDCVVLTTENGMGSSNTVVLEPEVLKSFEEWIANLRAEVLRGREDET